jgi:general secretion pathway protein A
MNSIYHGHFGFTREPFNVTPDPSFLYLSGSHKEALAQLVYGIKARRGFVVLTGEVGTGKTTLIHSVLRELNDGHTHSAFIFNLIGSQKDLLRSVCQDFGLTPPVESEREIHDYLNLLNRFLLDSYRNGDNVALIIDEAQNLSAEVLESVRLLSNFETPQDKLLQILLVGQPELGARLNRSELRQLKQRVALRYHLSPLNLTECREYIAKRLEIADGNIALFTDKAVEAVHTYSGGIPRLINILCDNGLLTAYALREKWVGAAMIAEVARDLQLVVGPRNVVAGPEAFGIKPKKAFSRESKEEDSQLMDRQGVEPPPKSSVEQSLPNVLPDGEPAMDDDLKRPDGILHHPNGPNGEVPTAAQSGSGIVPSQFFDGMIHALTEAMGPMAPLVVREQLAALGNSSTTFSAATLEKLVELVSREILDDLLKTAFKERMSAAIGALNNSDSHSIKEAT